MSRRPAAATTWIFRGDESRRRRVRDVDIPPRPVRRYTPLTRQIVAAGPGCHAELLELVDSVGGARLDDEAAG